MKESGFSHTCLNVEAGDYTQSRQSCTNVAYVGSD